MKHELGNNHANYERHQVDSSLVRVNRAGTRGLPPRSQGCACGPRHGPRPAPTTCASSGRRLTEPPASSLPRVATGGSRPASGVRGWPQAFALGQNPGLSPTRPVAPFSGLHPVIGGPFARRRRPARYENWTQRPMPVQLGQQVQEVLRGQRRCGAGSGVRSPIGGARPDGRRRSQARIRGNQRLRAPNGPARQAEIPDARSQSRAPARHLEPFTVGLLRVAACCRSPDDPHQLIC